MAPDDSSGTSDADETTTEEELTSRKQRAASQIDEGTECDVEQSNVRQTNTKESYSAGRQHIKIANADNGGGHT